MSHFFVDLEFTQLEAPHEAISVAVVKEDGSKIYAVLKEWDEPAGRGEEICSGFVKTVVLPRLRRQRDERLTSAQACAAIEAFVGTDEFLAWSDYEEDVNVFRSIWEVAGRPYPGHWPRRFEDLRELAARSPGFEYPDFNGEAHNALDDALGHLACWEAGLKEGYEWNKHRFQRGRAL